MSKQLYIVYETDAWHTTSTRICKGIFTSLSTAIRNILKNHEIEADEVFEIEEKPKTKAEKEELRKEVNEVIRGELEDRLQTQGYCTNYEIEICSANEWTE